jgi:hypothetical protein
MMVAADHGYDEIVRFLVEKGANINTKRSGDYKTVLDIYLDNNQNDNPMIDFLLENGAKANDSSNIDHHKLADIMKAVEELKSIVFDSKASKSSKMDRMQEFHQKLLENDKLKKCVKSVYIFASLTSMAILGRNTELLDFLLANDVIDASDQSIELWGKTKNTPKTEVDQHIDAVIKVAKLQDDLRFNRNGAQKALRELMESNIPLPAVVIEIITNYIIQNKLAEEEETKDKLTPEQQMKNDLQDLKGKERKEKKDQNYDDRSKPSKKIVGLDVENLEEVSDEQEIDSDDDSNSNSSGATKKEKKEGKGR